LKTPEKFQLIALDNL